MRKIFHIVPLTCATLFVLAGCSGGGDDKAPSVEIDVRDAATRDTTTPTTSTTTTTTTTTPTTTTTTPTTTTSTTTTTTTEPTTTTTTDASIPYVPAPEDFVLEVQVLEQQCFGSAGCNVTFQLGVDYGGAPVYAGEGPYTVVYTLTGTDDPFVGRFTFTPPTELTQYEEFVQTPPGATLVATVTEVF